MNSSLDGKGFISVPWSAPANVHAVITTRHGGMSSPPFASNNLAVHVGDDPDVVQANRQQLAKQIGVECWQWLNQIHSSEVVSASFADNNVPSADACITREPGLALAVLTADCLPILLCDDLGEQVAVCHAGWRGLAAGVLHNTVAKFDAVPAGIHAYIGPAIGAAHFEIDAPVIDAFVQAPTFSGINVEGYFTPTSNKPGHWQGHLAGLAAAQLKALGVRSVGGGELCTVTEKQHFYSYRAEHTTGRFASIIWRS